MSNQPHEASLIYAVGRVHQFVRREMGLRLAPWQLTVQEYTALSVLRARPGLSNAQLARRALVAPQSMLEILAKLERRRLVARTVDPGHGRILRTTPTEAGLTLLASADPAVAAIQDKVLAGVPSAQRAVLKSAMRAAMAHVSAAPPDGDG
ncbi:MAG TPA: MarR family winged helix-turn-helix transcriptional regulator [Solirubrobacteraceae bacterium]|jgi:DNA-binding MarR family transcriptional regulator|nr:MarR family winged helix-turn-helix transcriptional regulator [Solirubrobacteraceae bacterium]